jgi:hypothetical protein
MPRPSDMDGDPAAPKIVFEVVIRIVPDVPFPTTPASTPATSAAISTRIQDRAGITPTSVTIDAAGNATVVVPDTGVDEGFWTAWVASAMAAYARPGIVSAMGNRARVLP